MAFRLELHYGGTRVFVLHCNTTSCRKWRMVPPNLNHCDYVMTMDFDMVPKKPPWWRRAPVKKWSKLIGGNFILHHIRFTLQPRHVGWRTSSMD